MKTKLLLLGVILISYITASGCITDNTRVATETRSLEKFTGIDLKNAANVFISQGEIQEVKIEAENEIISHITTAIKNNVLRINTDQNIVFDEPVNIYITLKDISLLKISGSGNITTSEEIKSPNLELCLTGSGNIHALVDSKTINIASSGSGDIETKGKTNSSEIMVKGSGNINAKELLTHTSEISISGSGRTIVDVNDDLNVEINGSGNVYYVSYPERIYARSSGTGTVKSINDPDSYRETN